MPAKFRVRWLAVKLKFAEICVITQVLVSGRKTKYAVEGDEAPLGIATNQIETVLPWGIGAPAGPTNGPPRMQLAASHLQSH
jgi:hypothetical protein